MEFVTNPVLTMFTVKMALQHVVYISYLVPISRIRSLVPDDIQLDVYDSDQVFVSVVGMKCNDVRSAVLPWPRFNYSQLNLRTYVTNPDTGNRAVYFLQSGVTSAVTSYLTGLMGISWQRISFEVSTRSAREGYLQSYTATGNWNGEIVINVSDLESRAGPVQSIIDHITGPLTGLIGLKQHTMSFGIRHRALDVWSGKLEEISYPYLFKAGIVSEEEIRQPHNVLYVPEAEFSIMLPPKRV